MIGGNKQGAPRKENLKRSGPAGFAGEPPRRMKKLRAEVKAVQENSAEKELTEKEKKLIELIRSTGYGEIRVAVRDGQPVLVEEVKKSFKL